MAYFTWLVTGTNRGLGLTIVRYLLQNPSNVVLAACRTPQSASCLHDLGAASAGKLNIMQLDVADPKSIDESVESAKAVIAEHGLDYLINNAGVGSRTENMFDTPTAEWRDWLASVLHINAIGPALITKTYLPFLEREGRRGVVLNISSRWSSFAGNGGAVAPAYSMSKAALNMLTFKQAQERPNLTFCAISPGWVQTEMGGPDALISADESALSLIKFAVNARKEHSGKLFNFNGTPMGW
ncbi:hypothetical protein K488DRAFT_80614 [Vararia minispora EC-137]|uniref:Uncharacterized protein n=1 Tax=Vararia minispora EC-137 TaxID=1314806 RepID=A0ACB8QBC7_9AGAM|nr:hypothetical protein K488DRAFT_80614 [Vararia minispora EC-137]